MKKSVIALFMMSLCLTAFGQNINIDYPDPPKPTFQGQDANAFKKWVDERLVFNPDAKAEGLGGRVMLQFTIKADGTMDDVKVLRGIDPRLDNEAIRVVSASPKWEQHADKPRPITYTFPVIFENDTPNPYPFDEFEYAGKQKTEKLKIYSISHGSIVIQTTFHKLFIDPVMNLSGKKSTYGWFKPGQATILLTHEHPDHLSKEAIDYLADTSTEKSYAIYGNSASIDKLGKGTVLKNGDTVSVDHARVHIKAVPAYNNTKGHLKFHPKGTGNGYLIEIGDQVIYVAGDTEVIPEMKKLGKVDIAILPVNQPYTMTPEQCIKAAKIIKPKVLIPYHMGSTDMTPVIKAFDNSDIRVIFHEELR